VTIHKVHIYDTSIQNHFRAINYINKTIIYNNSDSRTTTLELQAAHQF